MRGISAVLGALALATSVQAHGYVQAVTAGGQTYTGYLPYQDPYTSPTPSRIIRKIPGNGPVEDLSLIDVQCNGWSAGGSAYVGSAPAALTATVAAGSTVSLNWTTWPDSHLGPIITYLAKAPSDITKWSPGTSKVWFKIAESGYTGSQWATQALIAANGIWSFKIPSTLAAGQYLVRHEIIALHSAYAYPGAQVYPSCIQLTVTGGGSATGPSSSSLVAFPGAYTGSTQGIVFDVYQGTPSAYKIPGPTIWTG